MAKKNQGAIPQANVPHIAVPRDCEKESVSSSQSSIGSSQNSTEESSSSFPATTDSSRNSTEKSMSLFSFATTTDSSENTSKESMLKKHEILEAQDSITMNKIQEMRSPKTSTSSEHHKNMKKYYKKKENQIKLKIRLEKYMLEMKLLEMKIKDLSTYLDICVCENKEDCKDNH